MDQERLRWCPPLTLPRSARVPPSPRWRGEGGGEGPAPAEQPVRDPLQKAAPRSTPVEFRHYIAGEPAQLLDELGGRQPFGPVDHEIFPAPVFSPHRFNS